MSAHFTLTNRETGEVEFAGNRVTKRHPCPVCGKGDWCLHDATRGLTICPRTPNLRAIGDAGYLHGATPKERAVVHRAAAGMVPPPELKDFGPLAAGYREAGVRWKCYDAGMLAIDLKLPLHELYAYGLGWSDHYRAWSFPMYNFEGGCIGIRLRDGDGFKWAVPGSRNGLFIPFAFTDDGPLMIEEGPTSAAAIRSLGLDAIGRPSCSACVEMTTAYCDRWRGREIVIVANRDGAKQRGDGSTFYPGQDGANKLADAFANHRRRVKVIEPPPGLKDSREWVAAGATRDSVLAAAAATEPHYRKEAE